MKPIYLEWSAFGPFADRVVLPIEQLVSEGVFLIHGATGAGKTTMFDVISFALFGNASGEYRQVDSFRSDFAKEDIKTYVILEFSHNGALYRIERSPAYRRKKQRGEGYTDSKAEAILCMPDGSKIVGYQTVTEKIEEILSVDWKQFKQISMIAQGEFLKLLTVESKERGEIFRKVFHTGDLEQIGRKLKEQLLKTKRACEEIDRSLIQYYSGMEFPKESEYATRIEEFLEKKEIALTKDFLDIIKDFIQTDKKAQRLCKEQIAQIEQDIIQLQLKKVKKEELEEKRKELISLEEQFPQLLFRQQTKEGKKERLFLAQKANSFVRSAWEVYQKTVVETTEFLSLIEENKKKVAELKKEEDQIVLFYQKAQADKIAIEQIVFQIEKLKAEQKRLREKEEQELHYESKMQEVISLQEQEKQQQLLMTQKEIKLEQCKKKHETLTEIFQKGRELELKERELKQEIEQLQLWKKHFETYQNLRSNYERLVAEITTRLEKQQESTVELQKLETAYTCEQAGILALELRKGKPCPVCGSLVHPKPAKLSYFVPNKEELEKKRADHEYSRKRIEELGQEAAAQKSALEFLLEQMELPDDISIEQLILQRDETEHLRRKELEEVEQQLDILVKQQEEAIQAKEEERIIATELEKEIFVLNTLQEKRRKLIIEQEAIKQTMQRICQGVTYNTASEAEQALKELEAEQKQKKEEIFFAEQRYHEWNKEEQREIAVLEQLSRQKISYLRKEQKAWEEYEKQMFLAGFSKKEEYEAALLEEEDQIALEKEIQQIEQDWLRYQERKSFLEEELQKEKLEEIDDVLEEIEWLLKEKEQQKKQYTKQATRLQQNEKILEQVKIQLIKQEQLQKQYSEIVILSQVANGELAGKEKLPFEQYVQSFYFEQVVQQANLRLKRMSGGRYALLRRKEAENKRMVTGLDLEVMDYFTGKVRSVKSLSGGESFKAALSLALGLSDIIQRYTGGIVVETMFIDEGFGSLDKDSLEQAITILKDLATGNRMIGIISHVEELKECIEKKIVVIKGMHGSTIQMQG